MNESTLVESWADRATRFTTAFASGELSAAEFVAAARQLTEQISAHLAKLGDPKSLSLTELCSFAGV